MSFCHCSHPKIHGGIVSRIEFYLLPEGYRPFSGDLLISGRLREHLNNVAKYQLIMVSLSVNVILAKRMVKLKNPFNN